MGSGAIGLDIGTSSVRAVELGLRHGRAEIVAVGQVPLPPGAVRAGEVVDVDTVAGAIRQLWSDVRFTSKRVHLGVANQRTIVRQVELPWMPLPELRASLAMHVADLLPMPVESAALAFHPLAEVEQGDRRAWRGLLVGASREMVEGHVQAVQQAGLKPASLDLGPFAMLRALGWEEPALADSGPVRALVDIGAGTTTMIVHQQGKPRFIRILVLGGNHLTEAIGQALGQSFEQAEAVKRGTVEAADAGRVAEAVAGSRALLVDEIRGSLSFYGSANASAPVTEIVVSGGGALLVGLVEALSAATGMPVSQGDPLAGLGAGRKRRHSDLSDHIPYAAVPVGLALGAAS